MSSDQIIIQQLTNDLSDCNKTRSAAEAKLKTFQDANSQLSASYMAIQQQLREVQAANDKFGRETARLRTAMTDCSTYWVPPTEVMTDNYAAALTELGRRTQVLLQALSVVD